MSSGPDLPYSIAVRFGDAILQAGFTSIPNLVLDHYKTLGMNDHELVFTIHVWRFWWTERAPYPAIGTIAEKMGVHWQSAHRYAKALEKKGLLVMRERYSDNNAQVTSEYDFGPMIKKVLKLAEQKGFTPAEDPPNKTVRGGSNRNARGVPNKTDSGPLTEVLDKEYEIEKDPNQEDSSRYPSKIRQTHTLHKQEYDNVRLTLIEYVVDLSAEFIDTASIASSTTRAVNLFRRSGLSLEEFIDIMTEARAVTKERMASIKKRNRDGDKTRMPYYFAVLEDKIGLRQEEQAE